MYMLNLVIYMYMYCTCNNDYDYTYMYMYLYIILLFINHFIIRLFMVTDDPVSSIPPWVASLCSVVIFHPLCTGLESLLLEEFLNIHNTKTFLERHQLRMVSTVSNTHSYDITMTSL